MIDAVTRTAAAAIGRPDLGEIKATAAAHLTVVDLTHPHLQPLFDPRRALIWLANRANIDMVVVDGRILIEGGHYAGADEDAITSGGRLRFTRFGICLKHKPPSFSEWCA